MKRMCEIKKSTELWMDISVACVCACVCVFMCLPVCLWLRGDQSDVICAWYIYILNGKVTMKSIFVLNF